MKVQFGKAFERDVSALQANLRTRVGLAVQAVVSAANILEIPNVKKLKGAPNAFRIRVGDYRIGFFLEGETATFMRCLGEKTSIASSRDL